MANNITVKDQAGASVVVKTTDTGSVHTPHQNIDTLPGTLTGVATGAASSNTAAGLPATAVRRDTSAAASGVADGDYTLLSTDATGKLWVNTATPAGVFAEDAGHTSADLGYQVLTVRQDTAAALAGTDADYQPLITDASGRLHVNVGALPGGLTGYAEDAAHTTADKGAMALAVRNDAGTALAGTTGDYIPLTTDATGKLYTAAQASGPAASGAAVAGNPLLTGARAAAANPTAVDDGDAVAVQADAGGKLVVLPFAAAALVGSGHPDAITDTTATDVLDVAGAGLKWYVTDLRITNTDATTATLVTIQDDTAVTPIVIWRGYVAAVGGSISDHFTVPVPGGVNQKIQAVCGTTGATVYVDLVAFKAP